MMNERDYVLDLPNWKDVPIRFSGLDAKTIQKVIDICWDYYKENRKGDVVQDEN